MKKEIALTMLVAAAFVPAACRNETKPVAPRTKVEQAAAIRDQLRKKAPNQFWTVYLDALLLAREGRSEASHAAALKVLSVAPDHAPTVRGRLRGRRPRAAHRARRG